MVVVHEFVVHVDHDGAADFLLEVHKNKHARIRGHEVISTDTPPKERKALALPPPGHALEVLKQHDGRFKHGGKAGKKHPPSYVTLRVKSRQPVLDALREGERTVKEIAELTGRARSPWTTARIVNALVKERMIRPTTGAGKDTKYKLTNKGEQA